MITWSCERDDICAEATPTTPRLIIEFYNINNPDQLKTVRQLTVNGINEDGELLENISLESASPSSISLPLNFDLEGEETVTRFQLKLNSDFDVDDSNTSNPDFIEVRYTPEFIYVSRACGYKSIFNLAEVPFKKDGEAEGDDDTWIRSFEIINETIENENAAQIYIYH
ncbi:MAG: hypothetical protein ACJARX_001317 [Psychroserpens sp.]|jgi:hypothetical protein